MPDVLVVIPGILGSALRQRGREVWNLSLAAGLHAVGSLGRSVADLALSGDADDPDVLVDDVEAVGLLPDVHLIPYLWKIDGYGALAARLKRAFRIERGRNYFEFPYDWRRDNRAAARRLARLSDEWLRGWRESTGNAGAKLIIVAHSMGGLVAQYFLEVLGGWRDAKALLTFGTPFRGSVNALRALSEGIRKGPFGVIDLTTLVRSFTSVYQLLPTYPCLARGDGPLLRLADAPALPGMALSQVRDAAAFHNEVRDCAAAHERDEAYRRARYRNVPIVGTHQETLQSARMSGGTGLEFLYQLENENFRGDGTVPRISATPVDQSNRGLEMYVATAHASLQNADDALHHVCEVIAGIDLDLSATKYRFTQGAATRVSLECEDAFWDDEPVRVGVRTEPEPSPALSAVVRNVRTGEEAARIAFPAGRVGWARAEIPALAPGTYRCAIEAFTGAGSAADVFSVYSR